MRTFWFQNEQVSPSVIFTILKVERLEFGYRGKENKCAVKVSFNL